MDEEDWHKPTSTTRNILGILFIIIAFVWIALFYMHISSAYPHTTPDMPTIWLGIVITSLFIFLGFCIGFNVKTKEAVALFLIFTLWSLLFFLPLPQGYEEYIVTGYFFLLCGMLILHAKYKEFRRKKTQLKETEK